jgi:hypothetical protein
VSSSSSEKVRLGFTELGICDILADLGLSYPLLLGEMVSLDFLEVTTALSVGGILFPIISFIEGYAACKN